MGRPAAVSARVSLAFVGLMFTLPFVQPWHYVPLPLFYSEWLALVLGLAAFLPLLLARSAPRLELPWIAAAPLGLAALVVLQLVLGRVAYPQQAMLAVSYLAWAAAMTVLGRLLDREIGREALCTVLAWCLVGGGALTAVAGLLQQYDLRGPLAFVIIGKLSVRAHGNLAQANHYAAYLVLGMASVGLLRLRGRLPAWAAWGLAALLLCGTAISGSLSAWVYLVALMTLAGGLYWRHVVASYRDLAIYCLALIAGYLVAQWLAQLPWSQGAALAMTSLERLAEVPVLDSAGLRGLLWRHAWEIFRQAPFIGVGYGQFAWHNVLLAGVTGMPLDGVYHHAHNVVMQLLAETGLGGTGVVLGAVLLWARALRRSPFDAGLWWTLAVLAVIGLHSMVEFPLWYSYFLGMAAFLLGVTDRREGVIAAGRMPRLIVGAALLTGALFAVHTLTRYTLLEAALNPRTGDVWHEEPRAQVRELLGSRGSLMDPWIELAVARTFTMNRMAIGTKLELSERVMRFLPTPVIVYQHALLLALKGEEGEAVALLDRAFVAYPRHLRALVDEIDQLGAADAASIAPFVGHLRQHLAACTAASTCPAPDRHAAEKIGERQ